MPCQLSQRGNANVSAIMPRVPRSFLTGERSTGDIIDLSLAEDWLVRDEILQIGKAATADTWDASHLSFPDGFWGDRELIKDFAQFFNQHFQPYSTVLDNQVVLAPGAAGCIDAILYNICDSGDTILIPAPYWNGYDIFSRLRASVNPIPVFPSKISEAASFIDNLDSALKSSSSPVKALMISNPHNPLGHCFTRAQLETLLQFCETHNLVLISDEVFGPSVFQTPDVPSTKTFVSTLSLDCKALNCDPTRVCMVWSPSKVFTLSGLRVGCTVVQAHDDLRNGLALAAHMNISNLSVLATSAILRAPELPQIMSLNSKRLSQSYTTITSWLKELGLSYLPCNATPFLMVRIVPDAQTWEDEAEAVQALKDAKVLVSSGRSQHMTESEKGWARLTFALEPEKMQVAFERMKPVLDPGGRGKAVRFG